MNRYTQTAVASFGPLRQSDCGQKPGGFTRLTQEVLDWVKTVTTKMDVETVTYPGPGISDPVDASNVQHDSTFLTCTVGNIFMEL